MLNVEIDKSVMPWLGEISPEDTDAGCEQEPFLHRHAVVLLSFITG